MDEKTPETPKTATDGWAILRAAVAGCYGVSVDQIPAKPTLIDMLAAVEHAALNPGPNATPEEKKEAAEEANEWAKFKEKVLDITSGDVTVVNNLDFETSPSGHRVGKVVGRQVYAHSKPTDEQLENRYTYHAPKNDQVDRYAAIRAMILTAAKLIRDLSPCSPEQSSAFTALDSAMFFSNAAIARNE